MTKLIERFLMMFWGETPKPPAPAPLIESDLSKEQIAANFEIAKIKKEHQLSASIEHIVRVLESRIVAASHQAEPRVVWYASGWSIYPSREVLGRIAAPFIARGFKCDVNSADDARESRLCASNPISITIHLISNDK